MREGRIVTPDWLPDWKDSKNYPNPDEADNSQWAWEFLRRNENYQADYQKYSTQPRQGFLPLELRQKYGLDANSAFLNPASSSYWEVLDENPLQMISLRFRGTTLKVTTPEFDEESQRYIGQVRTDQEDVFAIHFDLHAQIKPQILQVEKYLLEKCKVKQCNGRNPGLLLTYLRLLDAQQVGISKPDMVNVLFKDKEGDSGKRSVENGLIAATTLRDHGYRHLYISPRYAKTKTKEPAIPHLIISA